MSQSRLSVAFKNPHKTLIPEVTHQKSGHRVEKAPCMCASGICMQAPAALPACLQDVLA